MTCVPSNIAREKYFVSHRDEILNPEYRYAIVSRDCHEHFKSLEELHAKHPQLSHFTKSSHGGVAQYGSTFKFIDIARELNLPVYKQEVLEQKLAHWDNKFVALMEEHEQLAQEQVKLETKVLTN